MSDPPASVEPPLLIARLSALGDVIHTLPAVVALRRASPGRAIGWVVEKPYEELVCHLGGVDEVFAVRTKHWRSSPLGSATRREVRDVTRAVRSFARGSDFVDFQGLFKSAIWGVLSGAERRWGFDRSTIRERGAGVLLNRRVRPHRAAHVVELNMQLASAVAGADLEEPALDFSSYELAPSDSLEELMGESPVVLLPGTGRVEKNWSPERYARLASLVFERTGKRSVVLWGPGEEELATVIAGISPIAVKAPPTSIRELVWTIRRAGIVVGGDTGPIHIAAAARAPVVGLYGPTDPGRNGPRGQLDRVVGRFGDEMNDIEVEVVLDQVVGDLAHGARPAVALK